MVIANDGHEAQRLDAILCGLERGVPRGASVVGIAKHNVRMNVWVQVLEPTLSVTGNRVFKRGIALGVARVPAPAVVGVARRLVLVAVTVYVHVGKGATGALEIKDSVILEVVLAVREGCLPLAMGMCRTGYPVCIVFCVG